jgi:hypothetical protein
MAHSDAGEVRLEHLPLVGNLVFKQGSTTRMTTTTPRDHNTQKSINWAWGWSIILSLAVLFASNARAHDPFEITATSYLRTNQLELFIEMEPRPARLLSGAPATIEPEIVLSQLELKAPTLVRIWSGPTELKPTSITAMEGTENHAQLRLLYPLPPVGPFRIETPLLAQLETEGPYGVTLTVLDMVNQKVLGQSVLFADTPEAAFTHPSSPLPTANPPSPHPPSEAPAEAASAKLDAAATTGASDSTSRPIVGWWVLVGLGIVAVLVWLSRRR